MVNCSYCGKEEFYGHVAWKKACRNCFNKGWDVLFQEQEAKKELAK